jgi:hypothetical protein
MSSLLYFPEEGSRARYMKRVQGKCTFGSSAIGTSSISGAVMTRTAAGTYTITTTDGFVKLKNASIIFNAASTTPVDLVPQLYSVDASAGLIKFKLLTGTVATDPSSGAEVYVELGFSDTDLDY